MTEVQLNLVSKDRLRSMGSMEKIRFILDEVRGGNVVVLENGLTPGEEAKLIEITMTEISPDDFPGIEMESYPSDEGSSPNFLKKLLGGDGGLRTRLTVVGPANQVQTIHKDRDVIQTLVRAA
ncbi:MAG: hypothetical protein MAG715_00373 [Methanonatronarchaeales archaeon]|nr:hypothetical protein [Methanonatronarchaeales archaeon]